MKEDHSFLQLHLSDNVVVIIHDIMKGSFLVVAGKTIVIKGKVTLGHKVAIREISRGDKIIKCGTSIGSATKAIEAGEHVHLHNMKSDYIPTYTLNNRFNE